MMPVATSARPSRCLSTSLLSVAAATACLSLAGCAGFNSPVSPVANAGPTLNGQVHGGQYPVSGSHIYLFAAGTTGYGSASSSRITVGAAGVTADASGNGYVTTDAGGNFSFPFYTCPSASSQVYVVAIGGNPGLGGTVSNSAITMLDALGPCGAINSNTSVSINEVSTAASVTLLQQFMVDITHIGSTAANMQGLTNAMALENDLVNVGVGSARMTNQAGTGAAPFRKLNTLGNVLAPCINSASPTASACANLFAAVTPIGATQATDVAAAMLLLAQNPANNVAGVYAQPNSSAPFSPGVTQQPADFTVSITYTGGGMTSPGDVVIDANGAAWAANCPSCAGVAGTDSIVGFSPSGAVLSGAAGYTAGIHKPQGIAFDPSGNLWSTNLAGNGAPDQVVKQTGSVLDFAFNDATINVPMGIALDGSGNAWVASQGGNAAVKVGSAGNNLATVTSPNFYSPTGVGIDTNGAIYAAGSGSSSILKFDINGNVLSPAGGYTGAGLNQPVNITVNNAQQIYTIDVGTSAISEIDGNTGASLSGTTGDFNNLNNANVLALDGFGTLWYANCGRICGGGTAPDDLNHVSATGVELVPTGGFTNNNLNRVGVAAIDGSGNVWVSNNAGGSLTEFLGLAGPVQTPLVTAVTRSQLGSRP